MPGRADDIPARAVDARALSAAPADKLTERLERLPPGHPSSPYDADGTRREPDSRLPDREARPDVRQPDDPGFRFTEAEWSEHKTETHEALADANAANRGSDYEHTRDPDRQLWTRERSIEHDAIIGSIYAEAKDVPNNREAIIAGGLCGAGKTTVLSEYAGIDRSQYLTISPDDIKEDLAKRGHVPHVEGLSPMEASDLVHRESSYIARQLAIRAQADGKNVIWDISMSSRQSTEERIDNLRASGYERVDAIFVDIPIDVSLQRADSRHRAGEEAYRSGVGLGGRCVPAEAITSQADSQWGSVNRRVLEELKPRFDRWDRWDNSVDGRSPRLAETNWRELNPEETT
jgi:predicted kinase